MYLTRDEKGLLAKASLAGVGLVLAVGLVWTMVSCDGAGSGGSAVATPTGEPIVAGSAVQTPTGEPAAQATATPTTGGDDQGGGGNGGIGDLDPAPKDCISYDPSTLTVASAGASGWALKYGGTHTMATLNTQADANDAKAVARRWTKACYIGRSNTRIDRQAFITRYFEGPSGLPLGLAPKLDCVSYNKNNLALVKAGDEWRVNDGGQSLPARFDTQADAARGQEVAQLWNRMCFIGRDNNRPDHEAYVFEYWLS
jgi:hypothetical protein